MQLKDPGLLRAQAYLAGNWQDADSGATFAVTDPASGALIGTVPAMGAAETRRAMTPRRRPRPAGAARPRASAPRCCAPGTS